MIGVIDSGSGGLNVIKECQKLYNEKFVYLVDNLNCPYGNKSEIEIYNITKNNIEYLLHNYDLDLIIIACNTASSVIDASKLNYKIPILKTYPNMAGVHKTNYETLLFATKNTIRYNKMVEFYCKNYDNFKTIHIKNLAKYIDYYLIDNNKKYIISKLHKKFLFNGHLKNKYKKVKYLSLGCTHFKHIECFLNEIFNNNINFLECERLVANNSKWLIRKPQNQSEIKIILTKDEPKLKSAIKKLLLEFNQKIDIT